MSDFFIMQKTPETIKKKWDAKWEGMKKNREIQTKKRLEKMKIKTEAEYDRYMTKLYKKDNAYLNKKRQEYDRKCRNEIRKLEGKKQRVYKIKELTRNQKLQLALAIAQENAKLRDTDKKGYGECSTCHQMKRWEQLAGGHNESRTIQGICLSPININAQCHNCNRKMGPKGNVAEREKIKLEYDKTIVYKYGRDALVRLRRKKQKCIEDPEGTAPSVPEIEKAIDDLKKENDRLWTEEKTFYKPGRRVATYKKYLATKKQREGEETK